MPSRSARDARRRALGQNFLRDPRVVADIVDGAEARGDSLLLDLGAGDGALTAEAAARGLRVRAVELDPAWVRVLRGRAKQWPGVEVVRGDVLGIEFPVDPFAVVSNAPYGVGTRLVRRLLTDAHGLTRAVVVLQAETARRLSGRPRCGRFAATWAPWFDLRAGRPVPARAFRPSPTVESALLTLEPRSRPLLSPAAFDAFCGLLDFAFAGRGRALAERLTPVFGSRRSARAALAAAGLPPESTPGDPHPEDYVQLFLESRRPRTPDGSRSRFAPGGAR